MDRAGAGLWVEYGTLVDPSLGYGLRTGKRFRKREKSPKGG